MGVARNVALDPRLVPGGGAVEMAVARGLNDKASTVSRKFTRHTMTNNMETAGQANDLLQNIAH